MIFDFDIEYFDYLKIYNLMLSWKNIECAQISLKIQKRKKKEN